MARPKKYLQKTVIAGDTIEIYKTQSSRYGLSIPRDENVGKTPEATVRNNQRLAERRLRQIINANFKDDDYHLIYKYFEHTHPANWKEAVEEMRRYWRRIQYEAKKAGIELRYIWAIETGKRGSIHFHVIVNKIEKKAELSFFQKQWKRQVTGEDGKKTWIKLGPVYCMSLWSDGQYNDLAKYIIKQTSETFREMKGKRWNCSRNLIKPKETVKEVKASQWRQEPKPPKGYVFDPSFPLENGVCAVTGLRYQRYGLIRIERQRWRRMQISDEEGKDSESQSETSPKNSRETFHEGPAETPC